MAFHCQVRRGYFCKSDNLKLLMTIKIKIKINKPCDIIVCITTLSISTRIPLCVYTDISTRLVFIGTNAVWTVKCNKYIQYSINEDSINIICCERCVIIDTNKPVGDHI